MQQHAGQRVTIALSAGEHADGLEYIVFRKQKAAEQAAQLGLGGARRGLKQIVEHARVGVERFVLVLSKIVDIGIVAQPQLAGGGWLRCRPAA